MSLETDLAAERRESGHPPRALVILNPKSGSCAAADVRACLERHLSGVEVRVHEVAHGDDVGAIVREAVKGGADPVVAAGGDGTVSTVADALVGTEAHLVILPLGTANVLARELGIPVELEGACSLGAHSVGLGSLAGDHHDVYRLDAMKVGDRHYFTQLGVGIDSLMIEGTADEHKRRFGRLAYLWTAATRLVGFHPRRFAVEIDGRAIRTKATQVLVANTGMMGQPPFRWGPDIRADDGRLNVCLVRARTLLDYLGLFYYVATRHHDRSPNVRYVVASRSVTIEARHPLPVQADGEILGHTPVRVEVVPAALRVVIPRGARAPEG